MMTKLFSTLLCIIMVITLFIGCITNPDSTLTTVYAMAADDDVQGKEAGSVIEGTQWLQKSGDPKLISVETGKVLGLGVTQRTRDWDCVDLKNLSTLAEGYNYIIIVTGNTVEGVKMKLSQPGSPWKTHVSQEVGDDGLFSLEKMFSYDELLADKAIRIQSEGTTEDFTINNIIINQTPLLDNTTTVENSSSNGVATDDINITFSAADKQRWGEYFSIPFENNVSTEWVSNFGQNDSFSLKGAHLPSSTDFTGAFNAVRLTFDKPLAKNAIYTISYSVYVPAEGNEGKDTLTGPGFVLNGDYAGSTGVVKFPDSPGTIAPGVWKRVSASTPVDGLSDTLKSIDFRYVVNDASKHPDLWYIDNLTIKQTLIDVETVEADYKKYTALKDIYKNYFMIGTTANNSPMTGDKLDLIKYHFNAFTPENEMKPASVEKVKGQFTFDTLDQQLAKVSGFYLIGHTLAWHSQTPGWMWGTPDVLTAEKAKANLDAYITSVLTRYGKKLYSMDVVNEAFADDKNDRDWRKNLRDNEGWYLALGSDWVELAFLKAAEIIDARGWKCKLYYNDYNLDFPDKAKSVYNMVKELNEKYAGKRPGGKLLIEGIGMQSHYNENTKLSNVETSIQLFSRLPGVALSITELDISYENSGSLTELQAKSQAVKYARLFNLYKKYAAGSANKKKGPIERVTFWGTNDADSWRGKSFPLLFDKHLRAKEAFKALLDTDKYIEIEASALMEYVEGVYVYDTARGDLWSGANIILGKDASKWPWSTAGDNAKLAFTPEKGMGYRLTINYTSKGTSSIRVRWVKDNTNGGFTKADQFFQNKHLYSPDQISTTIPGYFNMDMQPNGNYTLITEFKLDGAQEPEGLIGNIAIRGGGGGNAYTIEWLKVEKMGDGGNADELLVNWSKP